MIELGWPAGTREILEQLDRASPLGHGEQGGSGITRGGVCPLGRGDNGGPADWQGKAALYALFAHAGIHLVKLASFSPLLPGARFGQAPFTPFKGDQHYDREPMNKQPDYTDERSYPFCKLESFTDEALGDIVWQMMQTFKTTSKKMKGCRRVEDCNGSLLAKKKYRAQLDMKNIRATLVQHAADGKPFPTSMRNFNHSIGDAKAITMIRAHIRKQAKTTKRTYPQAKGKGEGKHARFN